MNESYRERLENKYLILHKSNMDRASKIERLEKEINRLKKELSHIKIHTDLKIEVYKKKISEQEKEIDHYKKEIDFLNYLTIH